IGILIEQYAGDFPLWLAPIQIRLLPVSDIQSEFAHQVQRDFLASGIRAEVDTSGERLGKMVRNAEKQKIPVMAVIGSKEVTDDSLSIRTRISGELGTIPVAIAKEKLLSAITERGDF
ncbi:MAG: His/Gly/Thr/Pro-type tRNA ligase C-terminal domain-containing protein, partial [Cyanobacteria bacterium P01_H01_bin.15]